MGAKIPSLIKIALISFCGISCSDSNSEIQAIMGNIKLYVSAETGYYKLGDVTQDIPSYEGIQTKEPRSEDWLIKPFSIIEGFEYKNGYEYELLVHKKTLSHPSTNGSYISYQLVKIISEIERK